MNGEGTATGRPACMNCSRAIWAVASCMATRSGLEVDVRFFALLVGL